MTQANVISQQELLELNSYAKENNLILTDLTEIVAPTLNIDPNSIEMHTYVLEPGTMQSRAYVAPKTKLS